MQHAIRTEVGARRLRGPAEVKAARNKLRRVAAAVPGDAERRWHFVLSGLCWRPSVCLYLLVRRPPPKTP